MARTAWMLLAVAVLLAAVLSDGCGPSRTHLPPQLSFPPHPPPLWVSEPHNLPCTQHPLSDTLARSAGSDASSGEEAATDLLAKAAAVHEPSDGEANAAMRPHGRVQALQEAGGGAPPTATHSAIHKARTHTPPLFLRVSCGPRDALLECQPLKCCRRRRAYLAMAILPCKENSAKRGGPQRHIK